MDDIEICDVIDDFRNFEIDPPLKRQVCPKCQRPVTVCWCPFLPSTPIHINTNVIILQHPFECSRSLSTTLMLYRGVETGKCSIVNGKRFPLSRHSGLWDVLKSPDTILVFPATDADDITTVADSNRAHNLVLLDGTWSQAKAMYNQNPLLKTIRKVSINHNSVSKYVIRSQPNDSCLSTLEAAAYALSVLEHQPNILQLLLRPLDALCDFQLQHGAGRRQSKQFRIENGLFTKKIKRHQSSHGFLRANDAPPPPGHVTLEQS